MFQAGFQGQQFRSLEFGGHVSQFETYALEFADFLAELFTLSCPGQRQVHSPFGAHQDKLPRPATVLRPATRWQRRSPCSTFPSRFSCGIRQSSNSSIALV